MHRRRLLTRTLATLLAAAGAAVGITPAASAGEQGWNEYSTDLPDLVTTSTGFAVTVTGPDAVCSMEHNGVVADHAPWQFTFPVPRPVQARTVAVHLCDGSVDTVWLPTEVAFSARPAILKAGRARQVVHLVNRTGQDAVVTVRDHAGRTVQTAPLPPGDHAVAINTTAARRTGQWTLTMTAADLSQTVPVTLARGWAVFDTTDPATFTPCSTVEWAYRPARQPRGVRTEAIRADITGAMARLSGLSGLQFVEVDPSSPDTVPGPRITFTWRSGLGRASATGSTSGAVTLNRLDRWAGTDRYAGFAAGRGGPAGRGWLIVHELLHVMGFDHTYSSRASLMYPINYGQAALTAQEKAGVAAVYQAARCWAA